MGVQTHILTLPGTPLLQAAGFSGDLVAFGPWLKVPC